MKKIFFPHFEKWMFMLIVFIAIGFYPSYWSKLGETFPVIQHIHAFFMCAWVLMSVAQPYLIVKKKTALHKTIGKWSYALVPLILISGYILIQMRYDRMLLELQQSVAMGTEQYSTAEMLNKVASAQRLGIIFFLMLFLFFSLAIIYRKKMLYHATFMVGAMFTSMDPALDRLVGYWTNRFEIEPNFFTSYGTQLFAMVLLIAIAIYQRSKQQSLIPISIVLSIYAIGFLIADFGGRTAAWQWFAECVLLRN